MAAGGFKEFVAGEVLDQDDINDYLMQGVLVFAGTAARGSAIGTAVEGQFAFLKDTDTLTYYSGSAWEELASIPSAVVSATSGTPTLGTVTSGGDTFNIYSYTGDGSITFSSAGTVDVLVLGGGGGGGNAGSQAAGGGGGAGGIVRLQSFFVNAGTVTVDVGAGGAANGVGFASSFGSLAVPAGARGADSTQDTRNGFDGASGGGAGVTSTGNFTGGKTVLAAQGNNGGNSFGSSTVGNRAGGGGGGAGAVGADATSAVGGAGGAGISSNITGTSLFYAGGGGGGARTTAGAGGSSVGGAGGTESDATAGNATANRGSGGGGGGNSSTLSRNGGLGSDGVVIVRVKV